MIITALQCCRAALSPGLSVIRSAASVNQKSVTFSRFGPICGSLRSEASSSGVEPGSGVESDAFELFFDCSEVTDFESCSSSDFIESLFVLFGTISSSSDSVVLFLPISASLGSWFSI